MDIFLDAFFSIDTDNSEEITIEELKVYMDKNNFEDDFIQKWLSFFDEDHNGKITLDEYCTALGLQSKKARLYRKTSFQSHQPIKKTTAGLQQAKPKLPEHLPDEVEVITQNMPMGLQIDIAEIAQEGLEREMTERDLARQLKQMLDKRTGRLWHVVIVVGQYWINYTHEPECSFHFKLGRHIFLIWKTPDA